MPGASGRYSLHIFPSTGSWSTGQGPTMWDRGLSMSSHLCHQQGHLEERGTNFVRLAQNVSVGSRGFQMFSTRSNAKGHRI